MEVQSWLIYLALAVIAAATPGPAILLITTNATLYGWRRTVYNALGNVFGLFSIGICTISGLGVILSKSLIVFNVIKYVGAAYLIYLGIRLFVQKNNYVSEEGQGARLVEMTRFKLFAQAFAVAVSNPKAIIFLTALFPQFINIDQPLPFQFIVLIATLMTVSFAFLMLYGFLATKATNWFKKSDNSKLVSRTSGMLFIMIGILLGSSSRG